MFDEIDNKSIDLNDDYDAQNIDLDVLIKDERITQEFDHDEQQRFFNKLIIDDDFL